MKKIISALLLTAILVSSALSLSSCGKSDGAPDKMQLVRGGEEYGYYFYAPEEWVVANSKDVAATYVSSIDYSSCTFVKTEMPVSEAGLYGAALVAEYFAEEKEKFPFEIKVDTDASGKKVAFGNADDAYRYVYTYTYDEKPFTCMQIFVFNDESFYIFTYTASSKEYSPEDGSYYQFYLKNKVLSILENFKFVEKKQASSEIKEYPKDKDGYMLVSDKSSSGFKLYVPEGYSVDYSSAFVSVSKENGANINVSELLDTTISVEDNYKKRKAELSLIADKEELNGELVPMFREIDVDGTIIEMENARAGSEYEYAYTIFGTEYHVYQVFVVVGHLSPKAYVFTYTAKDADFESGLDEAKKILHRIGF